MGTRGINERIRYCRNVNRSLRFLSNVFTNPKIHFYSQRRVFEDKDSVQKRMFKNLSENIVLDFHNKDLYEEIVEVVSFPRRISSLFSSPMFTRCNVIRRSMSRRKKYFSSDFLRSFEQLLQVNRTVNRKFFEQVNRQC